MRDSGARRRQRHWHPLFVHTGLSSPLLACAGCRTFVDKSLLEQGPEINFNAGLRTFSVCGLPVSQYLAIEVPEVAEFT